MTFVRVTRGFKGRPWRNFAANKSTGREKGVLLEFGRGNPQIRGSRTIPAPTKHQNHSGVSETYVICCGPLSYLLLGSTSAFLQMRLEKRRPTPLMEVSEYCTCARQRRKTSMCEVVVGGAREVGGGGCKFHKKKNGVCVRSVVWPYRLQTNGWHRKLAS